MKDKYLQLNAEQYIDSMTYSINKYIKKHKDRLTDDITMCFRNNNLYTNSKPRNVHIIETTVEFGYKEIKNDSTEEIIEMLKDQLKIYILREYVKDIKKYLNTSYKVKYWRNPSSVIFSCEKYKKCTNLYLKFYFSCEIGEEIYM